MRTAHITGTAMLPNTEYEAPERDLAIQVVLDALDESAINSQAIDGIYMPKPRPWTDQGFFSMFLTNILGCEPARTIEVYTGGTSGGNAFQTAVTDIRAGTVENALVVAVERNSVIETQQYFEYILSIFDREFQSPVGPSIPAVYAQSMQRYLHEYDVSRTDLASIVVKNRENGRNNPNALFDEPTTADAVLNSRAIADPLRLYECPVPCDGAAALVLSGEEERSEDAVDVVGLGAKHAPSHLLGPRRDSLSNLPAYRGAAAAALDDATLDVADVDAFEPYAPFPHIEAIFTEELGLFDRGEGAAAAARGETSPDGVTPVSPSGGCLGRGHPPMVTPLLNYVAATRQLRNEASNQIDGVNRVLTTSEHGHVDGATATVFCGGRGQ